MATIVYLDVEDEITSAAARIRTAADSRVALVVPFGSRVATSRINFRLLAREAMSNGKRLDIVAPDASARALAASAGIAVFASVGEYESALDEPADADGGDGTRGGSAARAAGAAAIVGAAATVAGTGAAAGSTGATGTGTGAAAIVTGAVPAGSRPAGAATVLGPVPQTRPVTVPSPARTAADDAELDAVVHRGRDPLAAPRRRSPGAGLLAGIALLIVGATVAAVAAFLLLPAADITVTPQVTPVGPLELTVRADPSVTVVDPANAVIPAQTVTIPVTVSSEFPATGVRTVTTPAKGTVRWKNCDPSSAYSIPRGTVVSTTSGIEFGIDEQVFLPVAVIQGGGTNVNLRCQTTEVGVTADTPGPEGNVRAGAIRVVPARYNRNLVTVNNPQPTSGGTKEEFPRVSKKDVDAATAKLQQQLNDQFLVELGDPSNVPSGATVFPETAVLGEPVPSVDPATLVGGEGESFSLGMSADGTVTAVDQSPVDAIAEAALTDAVKPGHELVEGSMRVDVGEGTVVNGVVEFPVSGSARQVQPVDAATLLPKVLGLSEAQAHALLDPYGDTRIHLWPGFVTTVPTFDRRVTLVVAEPFDPDPQPAATPTPRPTPVPTPSGTPVEGGGSSAEPVPSG